MQRLTPRQREIVRLVGRGLTQKDIGGRLDIGLGTVKTHLAHAFARTGSVSSHDLQWQIRAGELRTIAGKIQRLLDASNRHLATIRRWPTFRFSPHHPARAGAKSRL